MDENLYLPYEFNNSLIIPSNNSMPAELSSADKSILLAILVFYLIFLSICGILSIFKYIGAWKMYKKAGIDAWESLIPIHNTIVEFKLAGIKTYWYFLLFIPIVSLVIRCWKSIELAKAYGKGTGFGIGLFLLNPIFMAILGMGNSTYIGPSSATNNNVTNTVPNIPVSTSNADSVNVESVEAVVENNNNEPSSDQPVQESLFDDKLNGSTTSEDQKKDE